MSVEPVVHHSRRRPPQTTCPAPLGEATGQSSVPERPCAPRRVRWETCRARPPCLRAPGKLQVRAPLQRAPESPRTPHDASSERRRPEHVMEKPRSETISQLAVLRVAAWSVKRASWPTGGEQAAEAMSPIGSAPTGSGGQLTCHAPHHLSDQHHGPGPPADNTTPHPGGGTPRSRTPTTSRCTGRTPSPPLLMSPPKPERFTLNCPYPAGRSRSSREIGQQQLQLPLLLDTNTEFGDSRSECGLPGGLRRGADER